MISYLWSNGAGVLAGCVVVLAGAIAASVGRRRGRAEGVWAGGIAVSVLGILAVTLGRYGLPSGVCLACGFRWTPGGWNRFSTDFGFSEEIWLNVALFVPAGVLLSLRLRQVVVVAVGLTALSAAIEAVQGVLGLGTADVSDLCANSLGAYLGVLVGSIAGLAMSRAWRRRQLVVQVGLLVVLAGFFAATIPGQAASRQHDEIASLERMFAQTTLTDYEHWSTANRLGPMVFNIGSRYSDGASTTATTAIVRYPTSFMGVRQCVFSTWTAHDFSVRSAHGSSCTTFMG
ncbi:VanZ family protein [Kribbella sp. NPDC059898]|uniref:VanZ family protein n=1 Tax=Kribbella sp. NPDC059898 TaxID=3346995 RepID=UPI0036494639